MTRTLTQQIGDRAAEVAAALADAQEALGLERPAFDRVGEWDLLKLACDDETLREAGAPEDPQFGEGDGTVTIGRGADFWKARPGLIKFAGLPAIAAAYRHTGDATYARLFRDLVEDFWASLQPPKWAGGGMRLSRRIPQWAHFLPYFFDSKVIDEAFGKRRLDRGGEQLPGILATHKVRGRGNIRVLETLGLFWVAIRLPMVEGREECLARARWVFADTARRSVTPDGSYVEFDPNYHEIFRDSFYNLMIWRQAFPEVDLPDVSDAAVRIHDYAVVTRRPNGHACGIQESSSAWVGGTDMTRHLRRRREVRQLAGLPDELPPLVHCAADARQVFLRSGWGPGDDYLVFDASTWGGAHSHLARNSVQIFSRGRALLPDTGTLTYAMGCKGHEGDAFDHRIGPYGKSTRAHNTLNLNGWNQAPTNPDRLHVFGDEQCCGVVSTYSGGYWPGTYDWWFSEGFGAGIHAEHTRILAWIDTRFAVVIDHMMRWDERIHGGEAQQHPSLEMNWQLTPGGTVDLQTDAERPGFVAVYPEGGLLGHFAKLAGGMSLGVHEGETDPVRGWITTRGKARADLRKAGVFEDPKLAEWTDRSYCPAPQICGTAAPMQGFAETLVSVFVPFDGPTAPELTTELDGPVTDEFPGTAAGRLTLTWGDGTRDAVLWSNALGFPLFRAADETAGYTTDACLLHIRRDAAGALQYGSALDATHFEPETDADRPAAGRVRLR